MSEHPELTTDRLLLRRPRLRDAPRIASLLNNFEVTKNLARVPHPYTINMAVDWLVRQKREWAPDMVTFAVCDKRNGLMGFCGMHREGRSAEIGYWLGQPFWGQGYMTEAATAVIDWYFQTTGANRMVSGVFYFNAASLAVQEKLGFTRTGMGKRICIAQNAEIDHIETELTRDAFYKALETQ